MTRGVGTPHYMAPEIKNGNYSRSIDVYACGVILYEMLTGHPPFDGETPAEVLMKHQLDTPNLGKVPSTIRPVLERALEKDPTRRFQSVMEFARAVDGVYGGPRVDAPPIAPPPLNGKPPIPDTVVDERRSPAKAIPVVRPVANSSTPSVFRERLTELAGGFASAPAICLACTAPWALLNTATPWAVLAQVFLLSTTLTWALVLVGRLQRRPEKNPWARRSLHLAIGMGVGLLAFWLDGWAVPRGPRTRPRTTSSSSPAIASDPRRSARACATCSTSACRWLPAGGGLSATGGGKSACVFSRPSRPRSGRVCFSSSGRLIQRPSSLGSLQWSSPPSRSRPRVRGRRHRPCRRLCPSAAPGQCMLSVGGSG